MLKYNGAVQPVQQHILIGIRASSCLGGARPGYVCHCMLIVIKYRETSVMLPIRTRACLCGEELARARAFTQSVMARILFREHGSKRNNETEKGFNRIGFELGNQANQGNTKYDTHKIK